MKWLVLFVPLTVLAGCAPARETESETAKPTSTHAIATDKVIKSEVEWKQQLTPEQFSVTRMKGTEPAFTGEYWNNHEKGIYKCVCCGQELFGSEQKFDSGTGWPSYWQPIAGPAVRTEEDNTFFMRRTEVLCSRCDAHLGHVFNDGPNPTGLRYCINSAAMTFEKR